MDLQLENPYAEPAGGAYVWARGNLHAHSTRSDGKREPQAVIDAYAALGHQFLALSDHDRLADFTGLDPRGLALLSANEVSLGGCHILHLGARSRIEPDSNRQRVLDEIAATGGFAVLNHPCWESDFDHVPFPTLLELKGYRGIEIYNGSIIDDPGSPFALEKWDRLLSAGRQAWGFANDDSHSPKDDGRGWNVVRVPAGALTPAAVLEALRAGRFYASSGVSIERLEVQGVELRVEAPEAEAIEVVGEYGARVAWVEKPELVFDASHTRSPYLRVQCYGRAGRFAWTQPFRVRGEHLERIRELSEQKPKLNALRVERAPALDGSAAGDPWDRAKEGGVFYRSGDAATPSASTSVRCLVTQTHVYFGVRCEEPYMERLKATVLEDGTPTLWTDDSVEFFLDVEGKAENYFHLLANTLGHFCVAKNTGLAKEVQAQCRVKRGAQGWSVEFALALDSLGPGAKAAPGSRWGLHVCRNRKTVDETYFWAWVGASNHAPARFGKLSF